MGDMSSRRGRINGSEVRGTGVIVKGQVPFAEMLNYATTLTSMTQSGSRVTTSLALARAIPNLKLHLLFLLFLARSVISKNPIDTFGLASQLRLT
jgi:translation elongation factor EF-G